MQGRTSTKSSHDGSKPECCGRYDNMVICSYYCVSLVREERLSTFSRFMTDKENFCKACNPLSGAPSRSRHKGKEPGHIAGLAGIPREP